MKTLMTTAALAMTLIASSAIAQTIETTREINAQTTITRGNIDNVLNRINNHRPDSPFRASDYHAQVQDFKNLVDQKFKIFEDQMKNQIFAKAAFWIDQYNSIYHSNEFSDEQKEILLEQRYENLLQHMASVSEEYKSAIKNVYEIVPIKINIERVISPSTLLIESSKDHKVKIKVHHVINGQIIPARDLYVIHSKHTKKKWGRICYAFNSESECAWWESYDGLSSRGTPGQNIVYPANGRMHFEINLVELLTSNTKNTWIKAMNDMLSVPTIEIYQKFAYASLKGSCRSQICLGLKAADYSALLGQIRTLIDRDITFTLADGKEVELKALNQDIKEALNFLTIVDYPEKLPFDI